VRNEVIDENMSRLKTHSENHLVDRIGWLRAAVLGANDGIVSTASLIVGVAAASAKPSEILLTGVAGLVAGAMSMAWLRVNMFRSAPSPMPSMPISVARGKS
jgi:VIT1/CCC1 family predicted Fe2+/Mn2+ transporter